MKNIRLKYFWITFWLTALFVNETLVSWVLALTIGNYNFTDAFHKTFKYFTLGSYAFFTAIRLIPYLLLGGVVMILKARQKRATSAIAWGGLTGIVSMILYESWKVMLPFFTGGHVSSTTGLAFLIIPFFAIVTGIIGALTGWAVNYFLIEHTNRK